MTVRVDELSSDVTVDAGATASPGTGGSAQEAPPVSPDDLRAQLRRAARDAERTSAEAYGD
jgi:hypothetical protein